MPVRGAAAALVLGALVLVAISAGYAGPPTPGILVASNTPQADRSLAGLVLVTTRGTRRRVLSDAWTPLAAGGPAGPFAVVAAGDRHVSARPLVVVEGARATELPGSTGAGCVAWSAGGRTLTYVTGADVVYARLRGLALPAWDGTLWAASADDPAHPRALARGVFPAYECPLWSRSGSLAFVSRPSGTAGAWSLSVWRNDRVTPVARIAGPIISLHYRTFAWSPGGVRLAFIDGETLFGYADGRFLAVSVGHSTGVYTSGGTLLHVYPGLLNGWAGDAGVLTLTSRRYIVTLLRHSLVPPYREQAFERLFKVGTVADTRGRWTGYSHHRAAVFRRPDGSVLKRIPLGYEAWLVAGVGTDGRMIEPASAY